MGEEAFDQLWQKLCTAHYSGVKDGLADFSELGKPWEHSDDRVRETWNLITAPENLVLLRARLTENLNPVARRATENALSQCEVRSSSTTIN